MTINRNEITHYNDYLINKYKEENNYNYTECPKLILNFRDKEKYVLHINNL